MPNVDYPDAIPMWVPTADLFTTNTHAAIVIHKTASGNTPQEIAQYFINSSPGPSVHYVVGLDGTIVQCAPEALGAGGNCCLETGHDPFWNQFGNVNMNTVTLSVEHVDPSPSNSTPCPQAQIDASFKLVAHLAQKYNIPVTHIKPHSSLDPISRARCPGNYPFSDLIAYVQNGGSTMGTPQGWHDDGHTLTAPNGVPVVLGFREYVLNNNWDANNWPLQPEAGRNPIEDSNPSLGGGDWQPFRWTVLEYTTDRGVFVAWCGQELAYLRAHPATAPAPVVDTTALVAAINQIPDAIAPAVAAALVEAKKL